MYQEKKRSKKEREKAILLGLIDLYIKEGRPIGSHTLQEQGFEYLSSATIRNYFAKFEKLGLLSQQHSSGGRIPTTLAFREYANELLQNLKTEKRGLELPNKEEQLPNKEVIGFLQKSAEKFSDLTASALFLLTPSFDQDFVQSLRLVFLDQERILAVLFTDFGEIKTEVLFSWQKLTEKDLAYIEKFLLWKMGKGLLDEKKNERLNKLAHKFYTEIMLRQMAGYNKNRPEPLYRTGLAKLLETSEFKEPGQILKILSLFEDQNQLGALLKESMKINRLTLWIGEELGAFAQDLKEVSVIAKAYRVGYLPVGAIALLVPKRANYARLFHQLEAFSEQISRLLTLRIVKFKIPFSQGAELNLKESILLEDKSQTGE
ncbi:MAG: heat-inducible transcriptional repressor HrcA [Parachlamydiales bacterium]|jgi:heat-inducible transcriptional repressor